MNRAITKKYESIDALKKAEFTNVFVFEIHGQFITIKL